MNIKELEEIVAQDAAAPSAEQASRHPDQPEQEDSTDPVDRYTVTDSDVGKALSDLVKEAKDNIPTRLNEKEIDFLDDYILKGYAAHSFSLGYRKPIEVELQTPPTSLLTYADQELRNEEPTTNAGWLRLTNLYLFAIYLCRYGDHHPSYARTKQGHETAQQAQEEERRSVFESFEGFRNRLAFCRDMDGAIIDRVGQQIQALQAKVKRVLKHDQLQNF